MTSPITRGKYLRKGGSGGYTGRMRALCAPTYAEPPGRNAPKRYTKCLGGGHLIVDSRTVIGAMRWQQRNRELPDPKTFDPAKSYSSLELDDYAEAILREDARGNKAIGVYPAILFEEHLYNRRRREILVESGIPDETITHGLSKDGQTMFNRQHPQGRKVNSEKQRRDNGASYYR